nr:PREDICTED: peritrophin-1-like [Linepithema humile]
MTGYYSVALITVLAVVASAGVEVSANQIYNFLGNAQDLKSCHTTKNNIRLPHPTKCSMYFICQDGKIGSIHKCPGGLHFNPIIEQCDWPKGCISRPDDVETQPNVPEKDEENKSTPAVTQCAGRCPISDPKDKTILLPTNNDCTKYCACFNGSGIIMNCPTGLHFDKKLQICNYPRVAKCQSK